MDFDRTCLGDPAIDVGAFMAQCDKEALATGRDQLRQLADSFLDDYASYAGEVDEGLRHRARLMRVLALVRLAVRTFQYAPLAYARDGTSARSELLLHEAATCLAELDR
ncbi:MAG: hypothetical protein AUI36_06100 [Cyanobacteria bacterium 13_1_40CM_2_61_4]|nr:MAG: hypothetical protein AUI36_06100 [Cyanobacteria bacterium 13_1_40CM_2_61_4]